MQNDCKNGEDVVLLSVSVGVIILDNSSKNA